MASENRVFLSHIDRTSGLGSICSLCHNRSYVRSRYRTPALRVFRENLIFSPLFAYSSTPRATRNILKPPNLVYKLHTM